MIEAVAWGALVLAILLLLGAAFAAREAIHSRDAMIARRASETLDLKETLALRDRNLEVHRLLLKEAQRKMLAIKEAEQAAADAAAP